MEFTKGKIVVIVSVNVLIILLIILRICLGLSKAFIFILGADIAAIFCIFTCVFVKYRKNGRRRALEGSLVLEGQELKRTEYSFLRKVAGLPTKFRYRDLETATDKFQAVIGRGGSASVFKGILDDGTSIAVKRIEGTTHGEREFHAELTVIASIQHVNLVQLLGYCSVPGSPPLLVYEFICNGSLDNWIFPQKGGRNGQNFSCLAWNFRFRVAVDVAKALAYLHRDCRSRILHLDIKPENILLNEDFRAVVSDFGLSKLMRKDESRLYTTIRGTKGYLAPEWLLENGVSEKSDVYSYGMVLLEIIGGRRNVRLDQEGSNCSHRKWSYFPKIVTEKLREGKLMEVVDERLTDDSGVDEKQLRVLVHVALWCIQESPGLRPSMGYVVDMLEGRVIVEKPPETEMIVVDLLCLDDQILDGVQKPKVEIVTGQLLESQHRTTSNYSLSTSVLSGR
ncbi:hypothetical protein GIB67_025363 [Kingdonia uniflora]|uniref:Protein kinase domain-containing protein n=1 Tax=Kingdonia uniflora TaxID=39325 RepID=A0A7J7NBL7_9MAGN|nr:hypothetical protein GIB67_025363 [Kingdonia uniflora]